MDALPVQYIVEEGPAVSDQFESLSQDQAPLVDGDSQGAEASGEVSQPELPAQANVASESSEPVSAEPASGEPVTAESESAQPTLEVDQEPFLNPEVGESAFARLGLHGSVLRAIEEIGYEVPSPIQAEIIPYVLEGRDVVGQAQTGTGKTAAFALPLICRLEAAGPEGLGRKAGVQVLVLVPTRELAIQVSEAFGRYAAKLPSFHVLPIYGGTSYEPQLKHLRRGVQVVVATPGRLADHIRRGTLNLENLKTVVLDEADEMLRMGFFEEVEWILDRTPPGRQVALFSATLPEPIRKLARTVLDNPAEVTVREKTATASSIRQRHWMVSGLHKLDALTRLLESEEFEAMIVFVRMKTEATELSRKLQARGMECEALTGDVPQRDREAIVERVRAGDTDILVATDVAARGLDVPRITHVVNYDMPLDTESYIHRIGRTGRAGRSGEAILFVAPRERRMLLAIEKATRQRIEPMRMPTLEVIRDIRVSRFRQRILEVLEQPETALEGYRDMVSSLCEEQGLAVEDVAAACAHLAQGDGPGLFSGEKDAPGAAAGGSGSDKAAVVRDVAAAKAFSSQSKAPAYSGSPKDSAAWTDGEDQGEEGSQRAGRPSLKAWRIAVGHRDRIRPGMIVGAIANEVGIPGKDIGDILIEVDHSIVVLPGDLSPDQLAAFEETRIGSVRLNPQPAPLPPSGAARIAKDQRRGGFDSDRPSFGRKPFDRSRDRGGDRGSSFRRFDRDSGDRDRPFRPQDDQRFGDRPRPRSFEDRDRPSFGGGAPRRFPDGPPRDRDFPSRDREFRPSGPATGKRGFGASFPPAEDRREDYSRDRGPREGFGGPPRDFRRGPDDDRDRDFRGGRSDWSPRQDDFKRGGDFRDKKAGFGKPRGAKPKPRFEPPWGFPKGTKPGKPPKKR